MIEFNTHNAPCNNCHLPCNGEVCTAGYSSKHGKPNGKVIGAIVAMLNDSGRKAPRKITPNYWKKYSAVTRTTGKWR